MLHLPQRHVMIFVNDTKTAKTEYNIKNIRKSVKHNLSNNVYGNFFM